MPINVGTIIVGSPADGTFTLQGSGAAFSIGPVSAAPNPLPSAVPTSEPASSLHAVALPTLSPATTYSVAYQSPPGSPPCGPLEASGTIGTFTTQ